uniref:low affinity immunoglobulin gamma Fc region receptor III-like isoform X7 n=1 Tax=Phascolarctos cinereus TaxID=38626 RepID=UPI000A28106F|nr:low affinity immunoglobulin gamma Fc region receptor III-like isoform X7 [Phascolarctos cinereus]
MLTPSFRRILCSLEWTVLGWAERMFAAIFRIFVLLGVQSWHSLPAMRGLWTPQPGTITSSVLLWVALLCLAPAIRSNDWLLLQVERLEFMEGDSMILRCHSWRSKPLHKVAYYHNDQALKYELQSFDYIVPQVNYTHSGSYYCTGFMGHISHLSATVVITVQDPRPSTSSSFKFWHYVPFYVVMGILFAVDTGLYFTLKREVSLSKKNTWCPFSRQH